MFNAQFDWKEPYRWRTNLRMLLRAPFSRFLPKGVDCEVVGADHHWYNIDHESSGCYHCEVTRPGQLWRRADSVQRSEPSIDQNG